MAIGKPMPQDIFKYRAKFIEGFSARQCGFYLTGVVVGLVIFFWGIPNSPMNIRSIACAAGCLPFFLWVSVNPYGQPLEKIIIPFIEDNVLAPPIRKKEIHFPEYEAGRRQDPKEHSAKQSKEYTAIK